MLHEVRTKEEAEAMEMAMDQISDKAIESAEETLENIEGGVVTGYKKIEEGVVTGYKKIEDGVVSGYKKIEEGVVEGFNKVTDKFVEKFFTKDGETVEEAKERLAKASENLHANAEKIAAENQARVEASLEASKNVGKRD